MFTNSEIERIKLDDKYERGTCNNVYAQQIYELYISDYEAREITARHKEGLASHEIYKNVWAAIKNSKHFKNRFYVMSVGDCRVAVVKMPEFFAEQRHQRATGTDTPTFRGYTYAELRRMRAVEMIRKGDNDYAKQILRLIENKQDSGEIIAVDGSREQKEKYRLYAKVWGTINHTKFFKQDVVVKSIDAFHVMVVISRDLLNGEV